MKLPNVTANRQENTVTIEESFTIGPEGERTEIPISIDFNYETLAFDFNPEEQIDVGGVCSVVGAYAEAQLGGATAGAAGLAASEACGRILPGALEFLGDILDPNEALEERWDNIKQTMLTAAESILQEVPLPERDVPPGEVGEPPLLAQIGEVPFTIKTDGPPGAKTVVFSLPYTQEVSLSVDLLAPGSTLQEDASGVFLLANTGTVDEPIITNMLNISMAGTPSEVRMQEYSLRADGRSLAVFNGTLGEDTEFEGEFNLILQKGTYVLGVGHTDTEEVGHANATLRADKILEEVRPSIRNALLIGGGLLGIAGIALLVSRADER